jgi:glutamate formiminotransferase
MITIVYAYRNREISRIKKSFDSLKIQSNQNFNVELVDYGSNVEHSKEVQKLVSNYSNLI